MKKTLIRFGNFVFELVIKFVEFICSKYPIGIIFMFFLVLPFLIIPITFIDKTYDTTALTNIAFAILGGIASICFSWSRTIDAEDKKVIKKIIHSGELALQSSILFLLSSGFKYSQLKVQGIKTSSWVFKTVLAISEWLSAILFLVAFGSFIIATMKICIILRERLNNK